MTDKELIYEFKKHLRYDPKSGKFTWIARTSKCVNIGDEAGSVMLNGYRTIRFFRRQYYGHRLAWFMSYGRWPKHFIDHKNGQRDDNRLSNLRECSFSENSQNAALRKDNPSGLIGVGWDKSRRKWVARIRINGRNLHLGRFTCKHEAHAAYLTAKREMHSFQPTLRDASA